MIEIQALTKRHKEFVALDNFTLTIKKSSCFGLLGPNGAGKSTLIKILTCYWKPTSGSVHINGISTTEPDKLKPFIGWAPQDDSFYPGLTVHENLIYFGSLYRLSHVRLHEQSNRLLKLLGLYDKRNALASALSGGMKKRLNIAIALVHEPLVLFLDEPTVGVDPISRSELWTIIDKIKAQKVTILYTTHYLAEVERLCDTVGMIQAGKLITLDTPAGLKQKYASLEDAFVKLLGK
ncbi:ABC transporter ATP-binding protein [Candidatus Woesearchaeota archaeon]|nr:ABC transporter ATP-binding protein [Candidatus Woesearchaeota archaeon]